MVLCCHEFFCDTNLLGQRLDRGRAASSFGNSFQDFRLGGTGKLVRVPLASPVLFFAGQWNRESWTQGVPPDTHDHGQFRKALAEPEVAPRSVPSVESSVRSWEMFRVKLPLPSILATVMPASRPWPSSRSSS